MDDSVENIPIPSSQSDLDSESDNDAHLLLKHIKELSEAQDMSKKHEAESRTYKAIADRMVEELRLLHEKVEKLEQIDGEKALNENEQLKEKVAELEKKLSELTSHQQLKMDGREQIIERKFMGQIQTLQNLIAESKTKCDRLMAKIDQYEVDARDKQEIIEHYKKKNKKHKEHEYLRERLNYPDENDERNIHRSLPRSFETSDRKSDEFKKRIKKLEADNDDLQEKLGDCQSDLKYCEDELAQVRKEVEELTSQLEEKHQHCKQEYADMENGLRSVMDQREVAYDQCYEQMKTSNDILAASCADESNKYKAAKDEYELQNERLVFGRKRTKLNYKYAAVVKEKHHYHMTVKFLEDKQRKNEATASENEKTNKRLLEQSDNYSLLFRNFQEKEKENEVAKSNLRCDLENLTKERNEWKNRLNELKDEFEKLKGESDSAKRDLSVLAQFMETTPAEYKEGAKAFSELKKANMALRTKNIELLQRFVGYRNEDQQAAAPDQQKSKREINLNSKDGYAT